MAVLSQAWRYYSALAGFGVKICCLKVAEIDSLVARTAKTGLIWLLIRSFCTFSALDQGLLVLFIAVWC